MLKAGQVTDRFEPLLTSVMHAWVALARLPIGEPR